ncbi:MAG: protein kinase, partial [Kangiellaceae bacterium]|nr:protein kinase [Kangiellaceae bacterium]
ELNSHSNNAQFILSSEIELLLIQPMSYLSDSHFSKKLIGQIDKLPNDRLLGRLLHGLALLMQWRRHTTKALTFLIQAREIYQDISEKGGLSRILDTLGSVSSAVANHQHALLYYSESLAIKGLLNDAHGQAITLGNLSRLCLQLGRHQQARSFANLDLQLIDEKDVLSRARVLNLLARIEYSQKNWASARKTITEAIALVEQRNNETLFFCLKDLFLITLAEDSHSFETKNALEIALKKLHSLIPGKSEYHQVQYEFAQNIYLNKYSSISLDDACQLLVRMERLDLPEMEIEYRIWLCQLAHQNNQVSVANRHLLLARKVAKKTGFTRFLPNINSLMLEFNLKENINEEIVRTISDNIKKVDEGYLIRRKLGGGGFGEVFLAYDMINDRDVAVKRFHTGNLMDHRAQKSLWNQARLEFEAVASVNHPSIAKIFALGHDSMGSPYLVQEFVAGNDLQKLMQQNNQLSTALTYLIPIVRALAAVHDAGVIHRDIKPENILLNHQGVAVLVDFGIALLKGMTNKAEVEESVPQSTELENINLIVGTESYMAPEQRVTTNLDQSVDLFSLGCILYEWLSGERCIVKHEKNGKLTTWLGMNKHDTAVEIKENVCGPAYSLLKRLLSFDPNSRSNNAADVADEMQKLLEQG